MCRPDDSFYGRGRKILFEYDESIRGLFPRQNRSPQSLGLSFLIMGPVGHIIFTRVLHSLVLMVHCYEPCGLSPIGRFWLNGV